MLTLRPIRNQNRIIWSVISKFDLIRGHNSWSQFVVTIRGHNLVGFDKFVSDPKGRWGLAKLACIYSQLVTAWKRLDEFLPI